MCVYKDLVLYIAFQLLPGSSQLANPLTTDDKCTYHATLATCYQLVQSVLKIGFVLAK